MEYTGGALGILKKGDVVLLKVDKSEWLIVHVDKNGKVSMTNRKSTLGGARRRVASPKEISTKSPILAILKKQKAKQSAKKV